MQPLRNCRNSNGVKYTCLLDKRRWLVGIHPLVRAGLNLMAKGLSVPKSESSKVFSALDFARLQNTKPEIGSRSPASPTPPGGRSAATSSNQLSKYASRSKLLRSDRDVGTTVPSTSRNLHHRRERYHPYQFQNHNPCLGPRHWIDVLVLPGRGSDPGAITS